MSGGSARISIGICAVFFGIGLFILLRGDSNDTYSGILVCCIALMQLFDYAIWRNLQCYPGGPNDKGTRGLYILLWALPAILSLSGAFLATNIFADPASRTLLMGVGFVFTLLTIVLITLVYEDRNTWCSNPGVLWQPNYGFLHNEKVPMKPNILLLIGLLIPTILVDPFMLGTGTIVIATGSYLISRDFDPNFRGEWLSVNTLLMNAVAIWALLVPALRRDITGVSDKF
jgi:hypothetical protein